jgi:hypothetical protein
MMLMITPNLGYDLATTMTPTTHCPSMSSFKKKCLFFDDPQVGVARTHCTSFLKFESWVGVWFGGAHKYIEERGICN